MIIKDLSRKKKKQDKIKEETETTIEKKKMGESSLWLEMKEREDRKQKNSGSERKYGIEWFLDDYVIDWYKNPKKTVDIALEHGLDDGKVFKKLNLWYSVIRKVKVAVKVCEVDVNIVNVLKDIKKNFEDPKNVNTGYFYGRR